MWSTGRSEAALEAALPVPIDIRPLKSARRLRLRFDETTGKLRLTCPWRTSRRNALAWALDQRDWIETQLDAAGPGEPFEPGAMIPIEGRRRAHHLGSRRRRARRLWSMASFAAAARRRRRAPDRAIPQAASLGNHVGRGPGLCDGRRRQAAAVSVGDAGTRWGSCSSQGADPLQLAPDLRAARRCAATSSRTRSHTSSTSTTAPSFKALEARL